MREIKCIDNDYREENLTLNKKYEVLIENNETYKIKDDKGETIVTHKRRFEKC